MLAQQASHNQKDIADSLGINRNRMVILVDSLERKGLLQRRKNPHNRKEHILYLTEKGSTAVNDFERKRESLLAEVMQPLTKPEYETLFDLLCDSSPADKHT